MICKFVAPLVFGLLLQSFTFVVNQAQHSSPELRCNDYRRKLWMGSALIAGWNLLSLPFEYGAVRKVYYTHTNLFRRQQCRVSGRLESQHTQAIAPNSLNSLGTWARKIVCSVRQLVRGWSLYVRHPLLWASVSYGMLIQVPCPNNLIVKMYSLTDRHISSETFARYDICDRAR